jgi:hypothetical protein
VIGLREQAFYIRLRLPGFKTRLEGRTMVATGDIQPCALCETYNVRLEYRVWRPPKVEVLTPTLQQRDGEKIPHMYGQKHLCLYLPGGGYWSPDQELARTIIPWAALWLNYYELWHATGKWLGGGHEPGDDETITIGGKRNERKSRQPWDSLPHFEPRRRRHSRRVYRRLPR